MTAPVTPTRNERQANAREARIAARVLVDGRLVHPAAKHGTQGGYDTFGCRCELCTEAHRSYAAAQRESRRAARKTVRGTVVNPDATHGLDTGYTYFGCRCKRCTDAHRRAKARASAVPE